MRSTFLKRFVAALAVAALLCGSTLFLAHSHDADAPSHSEHCDLCSHFAATTGPVAAIALVGKPVLAVRQPITPVEDDRPFRRNVDSRLPRGPPAFELT